MKIRVPGSCSFLAALFMCVSCGPGEVEDAEWLTGGEFSTASVGCPSTDYVFRLTLNDDGSASVVVDRGFESAHDATWIAEGSATVVLQRPDGALDSHPISPGEQWEVVRGSACSGDGHYVHELYNRDLDSGTRELQGQLSRGSICLTPTEACSGITGANYFADLCPGTELPEPECEPPTD